jgi:hypothetical protein
MIGQTLPSGKLRVQSETRAPVAGAPHFASLPISQDPTPHLLIVGLGARADRQDRLPPWALEAAPRAHARAAANLPTGPTARRAGPSGQCPLPAALFGQSTAQNAGQPEISRGQEREFPFGGGNGRLELGLTVLRG